MQLSAVRGYLGDIWAKTIPAVFGETWETNKAEFEKDITDRFRRLEQFLADRDFLCGGLTYVDFAAYDLLNIFNLMFNLRLLAALPTLGKYYSRIDSFP